MEIFTIEYLSIYEYIYAMKIGIIGAMTEEIEDLKSRIGDFKTEERAGFSFFIGKIHCNK